MGFSKFDEFYSKNHGKHEHREVISNIFSWLPVLINKPRYPKLVTISGVANPRLAGRMRPRKEFLRRNLGLKLGEFSIFRVYFHKFCQKLAQKVNFLEIFPNAAERPIATPELYSISHIYLPNVLFCPKKWENIENLL